MSVSSVVRPRAFISSISEGFQDYRMAARAGVEAGGFEPLLFEDFPSLPTSPRTACLDNVAASDVVVLILAGSGGSSAPSGRTIVEEEYDEAAARGLRVLAFLHDVPCDAAAAALRQKVSNYVTGAFRKMFSNPVELHRLIEESLSPLVHQFPIPMRAPGDVKTALYAKRESHGEAILRVVFATERRDTFIDIVDLDDPQLHQKVFEIGHRGDIPLLSYEYGNRAAVAGSALVLSQTSDRRYTDNAGIVRVSVEHNGVISIDQHVTGRSRSDSTRRGFEDSCTILEADVFEAANRATGFVSDLLASIDPSVRHQRFLYNAGLFETGSRQLVERRPEGGIALRMSGGESCIAFEEPQLVTHEKLASPAEIAATILKMLRRGMRAG